MKVMIGGIEFSEKEFDEVKAVMREVNPVFAEAIEAAAYFEDEGDE